MTADLVFIWSKITNYSFKKHKYKDLLKFNKDLVKIDSNFCGYFASSSLPRPLTEVLNEGILSVRLSQA